MKLMDIARMSPEEKKTAMQEARLLKQLKSPFIVQYNNSFLEDKKIHIVMEFCGKGDLEGYLEKQKKKGDLVPED